MLYSLTIIALLSTAQAEPSENAVRLLSRFPVGAVPESPAVLDAVDALAERAGTEELTLLKSLVSHEKGAVRSSAQSAIAQIRARNGLPTEPAVPQKDQLLADLTTQE